MRRNPNSINYTPPPSNKKVLASSEPLGALSYFVGSLWLSGALSGSLWLWCSLAEGLIYFLLISDSLGEEVYLSST